MFFAEPQFLKRCPLPQSPPDRPLVLHNPLWSDGGSEVSDTSDKSDVSEASPSASRLSGVQPDKRRKARHPGIRSVIAQPGGFCKREAREVYSGTRPERRAPQGPPGKARTLRVQKKESRCNAQRQHDVQ